MNEPDELLSSLATYVADKQEFNENALFHARLCLADALGCAFLALQFEHCRKLLGPWVPGTIVPSGARVPGTSFVLDPILAAFNVGTLIRWLDYNDTFLAKEWAHPSDNLGGILPLMDHLSQTQKNPFTMRRLLQTLIKAYEIQGILSLENSFNQAGFDHVILVKAANAALGTELLGGSHEQIIAALSQVFIDTGPLRTYRHAPNTGSRKSWSAGDQASRGIQLAYITMRGEKGSQTPLSAPKYGLQDALFQGKPLVLAQNLGSYIIENILFKVTFPAEFHAQTAVEAALILHPKLKDKIEEIKSITIHTHNAALRIIDKKGPLHNFADRDHCMQYMVAIALINGELKAQHFSDEAAKDPRIDRLREKITLHEEPRFSKEYLDPSIRSIASSLTVALKDGTKLDPVTVEFPLGHRRRREESLPLFYQKLTHNLASHFPEPKVQELIALLKSPEELDPMPVSEFVSKLV